ncbi:Ribonuclease BN-like family protein [compost metagenome]
MSAYGAAGSLIALLLWIYYSAQIFFFGAVFTRQFALRFGKAERHAAPTAQTARAADSASTPDA